MRDKPFEHLSKQPAHVDPHGGLGNAAALCRLPKTSVRCVALRHVWAKLNVWDPAVRALPAH